MLVVASWPRPRYAVVLAAAALLAGCSRPVEPNRHLGSQIEFGDGSIVSYADIDPSGIPAAIGIRFDASALKSPPAEMSDQHHCVDRDADGTVERPEECLMGHEFVIPLPDELERNGNVPFEWVLLNWNPMGHIPPGIYDKPHFDIHFMIEPIESIFSIRDGTCGVEFVDCEQFEIARRPLPAELIPADFKDVEAVVPAMGNHLIDVTGSEFSGVPFTRTWIYGAYDGRITFYEEMSTVDYILSKSEVCHPVKTPDAVATAGYYPTEACYHYEAGEDTYSVSMEGFEYREAGSATVQGG